MPNWKFWDKSQSGSSPSAEQPASGRLFGVQPRTDLPGFGKTLSPDQAAQLLSLRRRRETVLFDVEQAELAVSPDNPWQERIVLIDEALAAVRAEAETAQVEIEPPGEPFPPAPIEEIKATDGPPPSVSFRIGDEQFLYQEDQDWAERGFQLARGELQLVEGDPATIMIAERGSANFANRFDTLTSSLFVFASDIRDQALEGNTLPSSVTVADLARPDLEHGGWFDWKGHSPAKARKEMRLHELQTEEQRLLENRARELEDLAKWEDRLPIARRRLADVDAEIAALGG